MKTPEVGDVLTLSPDKRYILVGLDPAARGWWFKARAEDGRSTLEGNLGLVWDSAEGAWRPGSEPSGPGDFPLSSATRPRELRAPPRRRQPG